MKLKINGFENEIQFDEEHINVLTINNSKCFSHIIGILNDKINGIESNEIFLLDEKNQEIKIDRKVHMALDVFNIDYNSRKILNKIYDIIAENIEKNQDYKVEKMVINLRNYIIQEINELPFEFIMKSELEIPEILKLYNLKIDDVNYTNILEKVEILIDIISTLKIADILIIPNLKLFLSDDELVELYKYSLYNNVKLLLIERNNKKQLKYERNIIIDENFCDFII